MQSPNQSRRPGTAPSSTSSISGMQAEFGRTIQLEGPSFGEVMKRKKRGKKAKIRTGSARSKRIASAPSQVDSFHTHEGSSTSHIVYGAHRRPNSSASRVSLNHAGQNSRKSLSASQSVVSLGPGSVSGVLPVHRDSITVGTIEEVILARRQEQLLLQQDFLSRQRATTRDSRDIQGDLDRPETLSPQTGVSAVGPTTGNGNRIVFDEKNPFGTTSLASKLGGNLQGFHTEKTNIEWDQRGGVELSPLHDVYMSSPMSVRMKSFELGQEKLKRKRVKQTYFDADFLHSSSGMAQRPQTSPASVRKPLASVDARDREIEELRSQCSMLASRLRELERIQVEQQQNAMLESTAVKEHSKHPGEGPDLVVSPPKSAHAAGNEANAKIVPFSLEDEEDSSESHPDTEEASTALAFTLREINGTLGMLDGVFTAKDAGIKMALKSRAVTAISSWFRGISARWRHKALLTAIRRIRRRKIRPVRKELERVVTRRDAIDDAISLFAAIRDESKRREHLQALHTYASYMSEIRSKWEEQASTMCQARNRREMQSIMKEWLVCALGPRSRKSIAKRYQSRRIAAREAIMDKRESKGLPRSGQVITNSMIREQMDMEATRIIHENRRKVWITLVFTRWSRIAVEPWRVKRRLADGHFRTAELWKRLLMWKKFLKGRNEVGTGAHGGRKRYTGRQRWQKRHNIFLIIQHHGTKLVRRCFTAWRVKAHQLAAVRKTFAGRMNAQCKNIIRAWKIQCDLSVRRKRIVIDEWKDYCQALWKVPFRAWYVWTQARKKEHAASRILLTAWQRKKLRELKYQVFKVWRHQAAYGKVEGMFSRVRLLRTLDEQKSLIKAIGESLDVTQDTLMTTKEALMHQISLNDENTKRLEKSASDTINTEMALHNAEQEVMRLQSILDSVAIIHPGTIRQLRLMNPSKQFKDRQMKELAHARQSFSATAEEEAIKLEKEKDETEDLTETLHTQMLKPKDPVLAATNKLNFEKEIDGGNPTPVKNVAENENASISTGATLSSNTKPLNVINNLPPPDVPADAVWVKPADASLVLRARRVHEVLETDISLQDTEEERQHYQALRHNKTKVEATAASTKDRSETTGHAMSFAKRISSAKVVKASSTAASADNHRSDILDHSDIIPEASRLRALLAFLLYADSDKLMETHPDPQKSGAHKEKDVDNQDQRDEEDGRIESRKRNIRRLGRSGNWGSFVEDLAARFPLKHPVNLDAQDRLMRRIGDAKARHVRNQTGTREPFNVLATRPKGSTMASFRMS